MTHNFEGIFDDDEKCLLLTHKACAEGWRWIDMRLIDEICKGSIVKVNEMIFFKDLKILLPKWFSVNSQTFPLQTCSKNPLCVFLAPVQDSNNNIIGSAKLFSSLCLDLYLYFYVNLITGIKQLSQQRWKYLITKRKEKIGIKIIIPVILKRRFKE